MIEWPTLPAPETPVHYTEHHGIGLRDWFAGQALLSADIWRCKLPPGHDDYISDSALLEEAKGIYRAADAMLRARALPIEKGGET